MRLAWDGRVLDAALDSTGPRPLDQAAMSSAVVPDLVSP